MRKLTSESSKILSDLPPSRAFYFHTDLEVYTGLCALNISQFCNIIKTISLDSLEFHLRRGDFEKWLRSIGDGVVAMQVAKVRKKGFSGEMLRTKLSTIMLRRLDKLKSL